MSVLLTTSLGEIVVDLWIEECPMACLNFLSLCKIKYFNNCKVFNIEKNGWFQSGDPTNTGKGGHSIFHLIERYKNKSQKDDNVIYFNDEIHVNRKHNQIGLLCMANKEEKPNTNASQFYITTTGRHLDYLDGKHTIFGKVEEGIEVVKDIDRLYTEKKDGLEVPIQTVRIRDAQVLFDPFEEEETLKTKYEDVLKCVKLLIPEKDPEPINDDQVIVLPHTDLNDTAAIEEKPTKESFEARKEREAKSRAAVLEMVGDLPDANAAPPDNVLFVCKLNQVTSDKSLRLLFSQFGKINKCEIVRDKHTGRSKRYAFIEFDTSEACETAFLKMENVILDDHRIHVDFSQSVAKLWWQNEQDKKTSASSSYQGNSDRKDERPHYVDDRRSNRDRNENRRPHERYDSHRYNDRRDDDHHKRKYYNDRERDGGYTKKNKY